MFGKATAKGDGACEGRNPMVLAGDESEMTEA